MNFIYILGVYGTPLCNSNHISQQTLIWYLMFVLIYSNWIFILFFSINAGVYGAPIANSHHISRSMSSHAGLAESMSSGGKTIFFCKLRFYR